jgi:cytochrome c-type biogenesis protein CcmH
VIVFATICALLMILALALVLPPLRHPDRIVAAGSATEANVAVYRRQLAEMQSDLRNRIITKEQLLRDREELEERLIADLPMASRAGRSGRPPNLDSGMIVYGLAVGLPAAAILLYLALGTPSALRYSGF